MKEGQKYNIPWYTIFWLEWTNFLVHLSTSLCNFNSREEGKRRRKIEGKKKEEKGKRKEREKYNIPWYTILVGGQIFSCTLAHPYTTSTLEKKEREGGKGKKKERGKEKQERRRNIAYHGTPS